MTSLMLAVLMAVAPAEAHKNHHHARPHHHQRAHKPLAKRGFTWVWVPGHWQRVGHTTVWVWGHWDLRPVALPPKHYRRR